MDQWSYPFRHVLNDELNRFGEDEPAPNDTDPVLRRAHEARMAGIAFSGGGIRSATFNLGVLQALADLRLLRKFHYLSTVSGGGYIGSWLVAWIHRRGGDLEEVSCALRTAWSEHLSGRAPEEIRFLRRFSNYLTPKLGWLGADTWTVIAIYLRNVLLNMTTLVAALAFVLMLPRVLGILMDVPLPPGTGLLSFSALAFLGLLVLVAACVSWNVLFLKRREGDIWTGEPLKAGELNVRQLLPRPRPNDSAAKDEILFPENSGGEFKNFVLDLEFTRETENACSTLAVRVAADGKKSASEREIQIGRSPSGGTGDIIGGQKADVHHLQPAGSSEPDRLRVVCVGQDCTVRLNGCVVNVGRARGPIAESGRIALRHPAGGKRVTVRSLLVRTLPDPPLPSRQGAVQAFIVLPLLLAGLISTQWLGQSEPLSRLLGVPASWSAWFDERPWVLWASVAAAVLILAQVLELLAEGWRRFRRRENEPLDKRKIASDLWRAIWSIISIAIGGAVGGLALAAFHQLLPAPGNFWPRLVWGPPAFIVAVSITLILYIGLRGHHLSEALREWWSRLGAWLLIYALLWTGLFVVALYSPPFLHWLAVNLKTALAALSLGWVATTFFGLLASTSSKTGRRTTSRWREMLAAVAPYIFIVGLIAGLSWGINGIISPTPAVPATRNAAASPGGVNVRVEGAERSPVEVKVSPNPNHGPSLRQTTTAHWQAMAAAHRGVRLDGLLSEALACVDALFEKGAPLSGNCLLLILLVSTLFIAGVLGVCVDINDFSMHMMYRNLLARCYLGASNAGLRNAHAFTGFDQNDDIPLASLAQADWTCENSGPFPIVNCSLNLVGGRELAWQQRKAASFVFTPLYCGYDFSDLPPGFCSTTPGPDRKPPAYAASRTPLTLATAMAISGAAASPNMGYHTSPAPAFLMTLFNVRLGWWIGNPRHKKGWSRSAPGWALGRLVAEMFGLTNAGGHYVYLSDGGHFENLGIFELVRRRCRFIIACDAEEDGEFGFGGLGNAIEKCRTDLGVDIELDVEAIGQRDENRRSRWHCAVGRIRYDLTDAGAHAGTILYLKSSLTGDEPTDILRYAERNAAFPHESTSDQWFGESQFESYRALGRHVAMSAFAPVEEPENLAGLTTERLFVNLAQRWHPPGAPIDPAFARRGETLNALYETLRTDENLRFLSQQIYSGWRGLVEGLEDAPAPKSPPDPWLPDKYQELRSGFYFCNRLILLMEDVYHDLHLEREHSHPDNRGWMNLFMHWSWSRMFRTTWTVSAANCGARFQNFCARHLDLEVGRIALADGELAAVLATKTQPSKSPLTYVEWQLLHSFFDAYPGLAPVSQLCLIQLHPGAAREEAPAAEEKKEPAFTAGFALLRQPREGEKGPQLTYFRVRDHMRRMGVARRGIYKLLATEASIGLDLQSMPEGALQRDDAASQTLFRDLYRGVRIEFELHGKDRAHGPRSDR